METPTFIALDNEWPVIRNIEFEGVELGLATCCRLVLTRVIQHFQVSIHVEKNGRIEMNFDLDGKIKFSDIPSGPYVAYSDKYRHDSHNEIAAKLLEPFTRLYLSISPLDVFMVRLDVRETARCWDSALSMTGDLIRRVRRPVKKPLRVKKP